MLPLYASGEYRLREPTGLSERVRLGLGAGVVPANHGSKVADVGDYTQDGIEVARVGFASAEVERGAEMAHRGGELPLRVYARAHPTRTPAPIARMMVEELVTLILIASVVAAIQVL